MFDFLDLSTLIYRVPALLLALSFHEYAHAVVSDSLGDPTPSATGRLTMNPLAHLDAVGTLLLVLCGFGWAKPVMIDPRYYKNYRSGVLKVSLAGPGGNLLLCFISIFLMGLLQRFGMLGMGGYQFLYWIMLYNVWFAFFNLIPVPPLDGSKATGLSFCINLICIFALALIGCHNITMFNHSTFVLSYLLLFGYDVSGKAYQMRLISLLIGAVLTASILYFKHRKVEYKRSFMDLFKEIHLSSSRTRWQICLSVGISSAMLIAALLNVPRVYWIGIAAMSVLIPFRKDVEYRTKHRVLGNILGSAIFFIAYLILPEEIRPCLGIIGGIGTGFSASYVWQSAFNAFSAITVAVPTFGLAYAVLLRIFTNVFGSIYMWLFNRVFDPFLLFINQIFERPKRITTTS